MKKLGFLIVLILHTAVFAKIITVPGDASKIQEGINLAQDGDTVLVAPGRYYENINFRGKNIHVASHFILSGDREKISETIIDGSKPVNSDTASCVLIISGETRQAVLEGFTLMDGKGTAWEDEHGAGIYTEGGGILIAMSSPTIRNNIIKNNRCAKVPRNGVSTGGGGIRAGDGEPLIENNIIENNSGMYGGGIVSNYASPVIRNNIIKNNKVYQMVLAAPTFGGGGVWTNGTGEPQIINNTIIGNSSTGLESLSIIAAGLGGGIFLWSKAVVKNNIVWGNTQDRETQIVVLSGQSSIKYNFVEDGYQGETNITGDPKFKNEFYELMEDSPCIDTGDPLEPFNDIEDPDKAGSALLPSMGTIRNDLGAFGGPFRLNFFNGTTDVLGNNELPDKFTLFQNYPNPFNPSTIIKFELKEVAAVEMVVVNMLGQRVDSIVNGEFPAGVHSFSYKPENLASGAYFCVLSLGNNRVASRKIMLVK